MDDINKEKDAKSIQKQLAYLEEWLALLTNQKFPGTLTLAELKAKLAQVEAFRKQND